MPGDLGYESMLLHFSKIIGRYATSLIGPTMR